MGGMVIGDVSHLLGRLRALRVVLESGPTTKSYITRGMAIVMADIQQDALDGAVAEIHALGAQVLPYRLDVSSAAAVEAMAAATAERFGAPHFVFNNAGVGSGGLIWELGVRDWEWVLGVNLMGVVHGVRVFTPRMLAAARRDPLRPHRQHRARWLPVQPAQHGHLQRRKHGGVAQRDAVPRPGLVTDQITVGAVPALVPTGTTRSELTGPRTPRRYADQEPAGRAR
jgi:NAD(P)-dependent dehydrogenase (short-subunit alcohol dehydrogenase family)